jgi:integrase/recombinase XerC
LAHAVNVFLAEWPAEGPRIPSAATVRAYRYGLSRLLDFAERRGRVFLSDLTPEMLRACAKATMGTPDDRARNWKGGESAANLVVAATRRMVIWLEHQGMSVHDLSVVRAPRAPERIQPRVAGDEFARMESAVLRRLLSGEPGADLTVVRDMALINVLSDTGLRAAEVCRMTVDSVNLEQGWVQVKGKGSKERALSIWEPNSKDGGPTVRLLQSWLDARSSLERASGHAYLWVNTAGRPLKPEALRRVLAGITKAAGIEGTRPPHAFRRGHFTEAYKESPETIRLLAARMGWSPRSHTMVDVYTRGADIELTRLAPVPLVSGRWRKGTTGESSAWGNKRNSVQAKMKEARAPAGVTKNDPAQATLGRETWDRAGHGTP